jgi:hypothetical protein
MENRQVLRHLPRRSVALKVIEAPPGPRHSAVVREHFRFSFFGFRARARGTVAKLVTFA